MQARSVESRLRNKKGQELVRALLEREVSDADVLAYAVAHGFKPKEVSNELAMHARQIEKAQKQGDTKAYNAVMKAAGYDVLNIKAEGGINIAVGSPEVADALDKVLKGGAKPRDPETE